MPASSRKHLLAGAFLVAAVATVVPQSPADQAPRYGIYSNMRASGGEYSGYEFILLPSNDGDYLVFQAAEGWPRKPLLLRLSRPEAAAVDSGIVVFEHPEMGPFTGVITADSLIGEFTRMKYTIRLRRGRSIWE